MEKDPLQQITESCRLGKPDGREKMYKYFYPQMIRICFRYAGDADGAGMIYNNAMLRVFKNFDSYCENGRVHAWVKTIVNRCCIDFYRSRNILKNAAEISGEETVVNPEVFENISNKEIQQIIKQLPSATAAVFMLFIYEGYTHKQIAAELGISENTSKWHVSDAKLKLQHRLQHLKEKKIKPDAIAQ